LKIAAKIALSRIPVNYSLLKLFLFKHGNMADPKYSFDVFQYHYLKVKKYLPDQFTVCELGPGDSVSTAMVAPCFGSCKTYLIDVGRFAETNMAI